MNQNKNDTNPQTKTQETKQVVELVQDKVENSKKEQENDKKIVKTVEDKTIIIPLKESVKVLMSTLTVDNYLEGISKARKFKNEGNIEKCLDMFEAMIKQGINFFEEYDVRLAHPYFRLGDVLLQRMEEKNELFGGNFQSKDKTGDAKKDPKADISEREQEIEVAWENLEIARVIVEKYLEKKNLEMTDIKKNSLLLADIFKRIGECEILKEDFTKAREEMAKGLKILEEIENVSTSRLLSENYFLMSRTISYEAKVGHAKEAKIYIEKAIEIMNNISKNLEEDKKKELEGVLNILEQKKKDLIEEINETNPADPKAIKDAISKTNFATSTSFPKSELKGEVKVNKLGSFGKGKGKEQENISKKLKEPVNCNENGKLIEKSIHKPLKKVQIDNVESKTEQKA